MPAWLASVVSRFGMAAVVGVSLFAALFVIVVPLGLLLRRRGRGSRDDAAGAPAALPASARAPALTEAEAKETFEKKVMAQIAQNEADQELRDQELLASLKLPVSTKKGEVLKKHITEEAKKDPVAIAQLVRAWLNESES